MNRISGYLCDSDVPHTVTLFRYPAGHSMFFQHGYVLAWRSNVLPPFYFNRRKQLRWTAATYAICPLIFFRTEGVRSLLTSKRGNKSFQSLAGSSSWLETSRQNVEKRDWYDLLCSNRVLFQCWDHTSQPSSFSQKSSQISTAKIITIVRTRFMFFFIPPVLITREMIPSTNITGLAKWPQNYIKDVKTLTVS
jgi:hypothetical protein